MALPSLHSTILYLFTTHLDQIIDLVHFLAVSRSVRDKLVTSSQIVGRIDRAKQRYASFDMSANLENAYEDKQPHFQDRLKWFPSDGQLIGTFRSGDLKEIMTLCSLQPLYDPRIYEAVGQSKSIPVIEYMLKKIAFDDPDLCNIVQSIAKGAASRGNIAYVQTVINTIGTIFPSHRCTCINYGLKCGSIETTNIELITWVFETTGPHIYNIAYFYEKSLSAAVRNVLQKYFVTESAIYGQTVIWIFSGNVIEINNHREEISAMMVNNNSCRIGLLDSAMASGLPDVIDTIISLNPQITRGMIVIAALYHGPLHLIPRYVLRHEARRYEVEDPAKLLVILEHFNLRFTSSLIKRLIWVEYPNLSCAYHLASRNLDAFIRATKGVTCVGVRRIIDYLSQSIEMGSKRRKL